MPIRWTYDRGLKILMVYTGVAMPLMAAFEIAYELPHLVVDYIIDLVFIFDILVTMRTCFYDQGQELVTDAKRIRKAYLRTRFSVDVVANFPFEVFAVAAGHSYKSPTFSGCKLFRLARFFRIIKVHNDRFIDVNDSGVRRLVSFFPLITHWTACIWWSIGYRAYSQGTATGKDWAGGTPWLSRPPKGSDFMGLRIGEDTDKAQQYFSSLYWAAGMLMKTPWIHPSTGAEKVFATCAMCMGAIMFAVLLGQINQVIGQLDESTVQRRNKLATFRHFCQYNKLSANLSKKVISYAVAEWNVTQGVPVGPTLKLVSPAIRSQLIYEMHKDTIKVCPMFSMVPVSLAKQMLSKSSTQVCLKNEHLLGHGQMARELFVLIKGSLQASVPQRMRKSDGRERAGSGSGTSKKMQFRVLEKQGQILGVWDPFDNNLAYPYEVVGKQFSVLINIPRGAVAEISTNFEDDTDTVLNMLSYEHELIMKALKLGQYAQTSMRMTPSLSANASELEDVAAAEADKAVDKHNRYRTMVCTMNRQLDTIGATLAYSVANISEAKQEAAVLAKLVDLMSRPESEGGNNPMATPSKATEVSDIGDQAETHQLDKELTVQGGMKKAAKTTESSDEKPQITRAEADQGAMKVTAAIVKG